MKSMRNKLNHLLTLVLLISTCNTINAQTADELNGDWQGENSGNRVRIEMNGNGVTVGAVSNNPGQSSGATLWVARGSGQYAYAFPGGQIARMELIGPERIRVTNPDGWTDTFRRYSKPAASAKAAKPPAQRPDDLGMAQIGIDNALFMLELIQDKLKLASDSKSQLSQAELVIMKCESDAHKQNIIIYQTVLAGQMSLQDAYIQVKNHTKCNAQEAIASAGEQMTTAPSKEKTPSISTPLGLKDMRADSIPSKPEEARYWLSGRVKAPDYVCSRDFCFQIPIRIRLFTSNELVGLVDAAYSSGDSGRFVFSQPLEAGLTWRAEITQQDPNGIYDCFVAGSSEVGTVGMYPEALHPNTARDVVDVNCTMTPKGRKILEVTK